MSGIKEMSEKIKKNLDDSRKAFEKRYKWRIDQVKKELIEEFLPHFEWALKELYSTHYNNVKYQIHNNYYIKLKERSK